MTEQQRVLWPKGLLLKAYKIKRLCNNGLNFTFCAFVYTITIIIITFNAGGRWQKVGKRDGMFSFPLSLLKIDPSEVQRIKSCGTSQFYG